MTVLATVLASIPSPGRDSIDIGPLHLRAYGVIIALGVYVAVPLGPRPLCRRAAAIAADITDMAVWCVPAGLVGARLYHVITDWQLFRGRWFDVVKIWQGGLGIWGAVAGGTLAGLIVAHRRGFDKALLFDVIAPVIPLAQAIGRFGNWFNQELFGRPTDLPWAPRDRRQPSPARLRAVRHLPPDVPLREPVEPRRRRRSCCSSSAASSCAEGRLFAVYVAAYTFGRFWIERLRIDPANHIAGLRVNDWVSVVVFAGAVAVLVFSGRPKAVAEEPAPSSS